MKIEIVISKLQHFIVKLVSPPPLPRKKIAAISKHEKCLYI